MNPYIVAIDDGYEVTKAISQEREVRIQTCVSLTMRNAASLLREDRRTESVYQIGNARYAVGDVREPIDTRYDEFPFSPANLAVAIHAISQIAPPYAKVHAIAGLPLRRYYDRMGAIFTDVIQRKSSAWLRQVRAADGRPLPSITRVSLLSEAVAAWFDFVINESYELDESKAHRYVAVVDIGGRTTDIAVLENAALDMQHSGTIDHGMLDVSNAVSSVLTDRFRIRSFARRLIDELVSSGTAIVGSAPVDLSEVVAYEKALLVERIEQAVLAHLGDSEPLIENLLFVGGGATALENELRKRFSKSVFVRDPQMANARGMYKYGVLVARTEHQAA